MRLIETNHAGLMKDLDSGSLISTDSKGLAAYKKQRQLKKENKSRINKLESKMNSIEEKLDLILKTIVSSQSD